jgi:hypothetical protein
MRDLGGGVVFDFAVERVAAGTSRYSHSSGLRCLLLRLRRRRSVGPRNGWLASDLLDVGFSDAARGRFAGLVFDVARWSQSRRLADRLVRSVVPDCSFSIRRLRVLLSRPGFGRGHKNEPTPTIPIGVSGAGGRDHSIRANRGSALDCFGTFADCGGGESLEPSSSERQRTSANVNERQ